RAATVRPRAGDGVLPFAPLGHGIDAARPERMAAEDAAHRQPDPTAGAVAADGLLGIDAAAGKVAAVTTQERREGHSIGLKRDEERPGPGAGRDGRPDFGRIPRTEPPLPPGTVRRSRAWLRAPRPGPRPRRACSCGSSSAG